MSDCQLRKFVEEITLANGRFKYLNGTPIVSAAYEVLRKTEKQCKLTKGKFYEKTN